MKNISFKNLRDLDQYLLDNPDISQEQREIIIETLLEYLKSEGGN